MGSSIEIAGEKIAILNDRDLVLVLKLLLEQLDQEKGIPPACQPFVDLWRQSADWSGPGTASAYVAEVVSVPEVAAFLDRQLERLVHRLAQFGDSIPVDELNERYRSTGQRFFDAYPIERLTHTIGKLRELLESPDSGKDDSD